jgi:hypothetical protein
MNHCKQKTNENCFFKKPKNKIKCNIEGYEDQYFEAGQIWKTAEGFNVEITTLDLEDKVFPIGYYFEDCTLWVTPQGEFYPNKTSKRDLVKLIEPIKNNKEAKLSDFSKQKEYYVFVSNGRAPKIAYKNIEEAEKEAKRLSKKEIGKEVSIVTKVKSYKSTIIVNEQNN